MTTKTCPNCSAEVQIDARFCFACGTNLTEPEAVQPSVLDSPEDSPSPDSPASAFEAESVSTVEDTPPPPPADDAPTTPPAEEEPPPPPIEEESPIETLTVPSMQNSASKPNLDVGHIFGHAWAKFQERPGLCIGAWVVFTLITGASGAGGGGGSSTGNSDVDAGIAIITLVGGLLFGCVAFVVAGPIRGGYDLTMVRHSAGEEGVEFGEIFSGFNKFLNLFLCNLLFSLTCLVGFCFLLIPGIIAGLTLWPAFLLVMEDDLDPIQAIKGAWELTSPHLGAIFVLGLATLAINIAGMLACCIGLLISGPVSQLVWATVYREIRGR